MKRMDEEYKNSRKYLIKEVLNPFEVPGIDLTIFERAEGLPED